MTTFQNTYPFTTEPTIGDNPWAGIVDKTRDVYVPDLLDVFRRAVFFSQFVPFQVDMGAASAEVMTFTTLYDLEPVTDPLATRQIWLNTNGTDSEQKSLYLAHYGDKVTLHAYDDIVNQWRKNGMMGLRGILRNQLAVSMTSFLETLARNAFLSGTWHMYGRDWSKSNFGALTAADTFDPNTTRDIYLGMRTRARSGAIDAATDGRGGTVVALTAPGVIYEIMDDPDFIEIHKYANPTRLLNYEVGTYKGVRYLEHPDMMLWNSGDIITQVAITEALPRGSGADRNVDANRVVGQSTMVNGGNRYVQCDGAADLSAIEPNDYITIHTVRTNDFGVTNGVDYRAGTNTHRRVVSVDNTTKRITLETPILKDVYSTDLGGGVYGYVTKGINVAATAFLTGPNSVVAGVAVPPNFKDVEPIDDLKEFYRFSWSTRMKYQIWSDHAVEVAFNAAKYRIKGPVR